MERWKKKLLPHAGELVMGLGALLGGLLIK